MNGHSVEEVVLEWMERSKAGTGNGMHVGSPQRLSYVAFGHDSSH